MICRRIPLGTTLRNPRMGAREEGGGGRGLSLRTGHGDGHGNTNGQSASLLYVLDSPTPHLILSHPIPSHPLLSPPTQSQKHHNSFHPVLQHTARFCCHAGMSNHSGRRCKGRLVFTLMPRHSSYFRANFARQSMHLPQYVHMACVVKVGAVITALNCFVAVLTHLRGGTLPHARQQPNF